MSGPVRHVHLLRRSGVDRTVGFAADNLLAGKSATLGQKDAVRLEDTLEGMRERWKTNRLGERKTRLQEIEKWFRFALQLKRSPDDLVQFARQPEFAKFRGRRPTSERPEEILRHVIRFVFGFGAGAKRRVSRYANALEPAFVAGITADDIASHVISHGGINRMARENARVRRPRRSSSAPIVTLNAEADDLALGLLSIESGQHVKMGLELQKRAGNTATIKITSLKIRKSPKRTD